MKTIKQRKYKHINTLTMKKAQCSPKIKEKNTGFSCYSFDDIHYLKKLWNNFNLSQLLSRSHAQIIKTNDTQKILRQLLKYNEKHCKNKPESCLLHLPFVIDKAKKDIKDFAFSPEVPKSWHKNPNEWLSSDDIINVMNQYEKAYKYFKFIGPSPIDFDKKIGGDNQCVWNDLCHFNLKKYIDAGISKIGIIFNTDPHNKPGEHWISLFINLPKKFIYFFDSVGHKAPSEIMQLVKRIQMQYSELYKGQLLTFDQNYPVEHQYGSTECGIYSLYFIVHMLQDKINKYYLKNHILKDNYIQNFRKIFFNTVL